VPAGVYLSVDVLTALCRLIILTYEGSSSCSTGVCRVGSWLIMSGMLVTMVCWMD